jgi:hypothetical protein
VCAFLASRLSTDIRISSLTPYPDPLLEKAVDCWKSNSILDEIPSNPTQKALDSAISDRLKIHIYSKSSPIDQNRLQSLYNNPAPEIVQVFPSKIFGNLLNNEQFRIAIGLRLGANIVSQHLCDDCGETVLANGQHGLSCRFSKGRSSRHKVCNVLIHKQLSAAGFPSSLEPVGLDPTPQNRRPDGVTLLEWNNQKPLAWDFTVPDIFAPSHFNMDFIVAAEKAKIRDYDFLQFNFNFIPVVVSTLGQFGPYAIEFLKTIGKKLSSKSRDNKEACYFREHLSIEIAKYNFICVLGTVPPLVNSV